MERTEWSEAWVSRGKLSGAREGYGDSLNFYGKVAQTKERRKPLVVFAYRKLMCQERMHTPVMRIAKRY